MGVREIGRFLEQWQMDAKALRRRMMLAPTLRERERWYAILLLAEGWTAAATAEALERDPHHRQMGRRLRRGRAHSLDFRAVGGEPPALGEGQQAELRAAVPELPTESDIELANWNWRAVRQFVRERFGISPEPQRWRELPPPFGVCPETPPEASGPGGPCQAGILRGGIRRPVGRGRAVWSPDMLRRRGALPGGRCTAGPVGAAGRASLGGLQQPAPW